MKFTITKILKSMWEFVIHYAKQGVKQYKRTIRNLRVSFGKLYTYYYLKFIYPCYKCNNCTMEISKNSWNTVAWIKIFAIYKEMKIT